MDNPVGLFDSMVSCEPMGTVQDIMIKILFIHSFIQSDISFANLVGLLSSLWLKLSGLPFKGPHCSLFLHWIPLITLFAPFLKQFYWRNVSIVQIMFTHTSISIFSFSPVHQPTPNPP